MADLPCREPEVTVLILQQRPEVVREVASVAVEEEAEDLSPSAVVSFSAELVVSSGWLFSVVSWCPPGVVSRSCPSFVVSAKYPSLVVS